MKWVWIAIHINSLMLAILSLGMLAFIVGCSYKEEKEAADINGYGMQAESVFQGPYLPKRFMAYL
jgi:hypothetical protein